MMIALDIAAALALRRMGTGWRGPCPVHGGTSFTLAEKDGKPLFTCWHGCDRAAILSELRRRGLWPERPRPERATSTPEEKRAWALRRRRAEALAYEVQTWRMAAVDSLEVQKADAYGAGDFDTVMVVAPELERVRGLRGAELAEAFIKARKERPGETAGLIIGRRRDEQIARKLCSWVVQKIGAKHDANARLAA